MQLVLKEKDTMTRLVLGKVENNSNEN